MLEKNNIVFKLAEPEHISVLVKYANMGGLVSSLKTRRKTCTTEQKKLIEESSADKAKFTFVLSHSKEDKGVCEVFEVDYINRLCKMNLFFDEKSDWEDESRSDALSVALNFIFDVLGMHKVIVETSTEDLKKFELYKKHLFSTEVRRRQHCFRNGKYETVLSMSLLEEEFEKLGV